MCVCFCVCLSYVLRFLLLLSGCLAVWLSGCLAVGRYENVGTAICITMIINIVNPSVITFLKVPLGRCKRWWKASSITTQTEMNDLYEGDSFDLAPRYARLMNVTFITFFFSAGTYAHGPAAVPMTPQIVQPCGWVAPHAKFIVFC